MAHWVDDALGRHNYAVIFPSEPEKKYDPRQYEMEQRLPTGVQHKIAVRHEVRTDTCDTGTGEPMVVKKTAETYQIVQVIPCATASHEEPHVCKNREISTEVLVDLESMAVTIHKMNTPPLPHMYVDKAFVFEGSDPAIVRAIGEMLIAAADIAVGEQKGEK